MTKIKKLPRPSEHREQSAFVERVKLSVNKHPALKMLFAIPNGAYFGNTLNRFPLAMKMKREGLKPGVPDLFLAAPSMGFHGLFIEMKRHPNKVIDGGEQDEFMKDLESFGYCCRVAWSADEAWEHLKNYLGI